MKSCNWQIHNTQYAATFMTWLIIAVSMLLSLQRNSNNQSIKYIAHLAYTCEHYTVKNKKLRKLKSLRQPASADFWVFSTFCCINWKQQVEKTQKSAETGCLKLFFFFYSVAQVHSVLNSMCKLQFTSFTCPWVERINSATHFVTLVLYFLNVTAIIQKVW